MIIRWIRNWNKKQKNRHKKVFVGISGGVDSSVAAALLIEEGYMVIGVFIRTWQPDFISCTWRQERRDAMRVCAHLGIPFVELDLENAYKQGVADYMIAEYRKGRTPNPDVMCNREVKFGGFLDWAKKQGAFAIATGHYAQTHNGQLYQGVDRAKDQSYFLWTLTQDQLLATLFPIGHIATKSEVRRIADRYGLPTAIKKDSQGVCFIGEIDMKEFLKHYITSAPGHVMDASGAIIGSHEGALLYTLGERHGFSVTQKGVDDKPLYVIAKDIVHNTLTVAPEPKKFLLSSSILLEDCVWRQPVVSNSDYMFQVRYHGTLNRCRLEPVTETSFRLISDEIEFSAAPGQSVVVYQGDCCIGGGIIA